MTIGERLRQLRTTRGWSVAKLASRSHIHTVAIRYYENDQRQPTVANLRQLCIALRVTLGAFHHCQPPSHELQEEPQVQQEEPQGDNTQPTFA